MITLPSERNLRAESSLVNNNMFFQIFQKCFQYVQLLLTGLKALMLMQITRIRIS